MSRAKQHILTLADALQEHLGITHWAVSMRLARKGDFLLRLHRGGDCRTETYERAMRHFSETWPDDLEWPEDIPRPSSSDEAEGD